MREDANIYSLCEANYNQEKHTKLSVARVYQNYKALNYANIHIQKHARNYNQEFG